MTLGRETAEYPPHIRTTERIAGEYGREMADLPVDSHNQTRPVTSLGADLDLGIDRLAVDRNVVRVF